MNGWNQGKRCEMFLSVNLRGILNSVKCVLFLHSCLQVFYGELHWRWLSRNWMGTHLFWKENSFSECHSSYTSETGCERNNKWLGQRWNVNQFTRFCLIDCGLKIATQLSIVKIHSLALYLPWLTVKAYLSNSFHYLQIPAEWVLEETFFSQR